MVSIKPTCADGLICYSQLALTNRNEPVCHARPSFLQFMNAFVSPGERVDVPESFVGIDERVVHRHMVSACGWCWGGGEQRVHNPAAEEVLATR